MVPDKFQRFAIKGGSAGGRRGEPQGGEPHLVWVGRLGPTLLASAPTPPPLFPCLIWRFKRVRIGKGKNKGKWQKDKREGRESLSNKDSPPQTDLGEGPASLGPAHQGEGFAPPPSTSSPCSPLYTPPPPTRRTSKKTENHKFLSS